MSAISGKIVDQDGDPVQGALVQLLRSEVTLGKRRIVPRGWARTNDLGEYRFGPTLGGSYYLAVTGRPWYSAMGPAAAAAYVPAYYPNTTDRAQAAPIEVAPGDEARADFSLTTTLGSRLTIKSDARPEQPCVLSLATEGIGETSGFQESVNVLSVITVVPAVPPGTYSLGLVCRGGGSALFASKEDVQVSGAEVTVELSARPAPTVSGSVQWKNPAAHPRGSILATLVAVDGAGFQATVVKPGGSFAFPTVVPGRYRPAIAGTDGYFASDIHVEGADFRDNVIELVEGQSVTLRMVASDETGRVRGFALRGDQPTEGALVVLAPEAPESPLSTYGFQTDSDGSFDFTHIRAGDYVLFAVDDLAFEYGNPAAVKPYLANAKAIRIEPHGAYDERIPLVDAIK
jgi:hypothetical protein